MSENTVVTDRSSNDEKDESGSMWSLIPEPILVNILRLLSHKDILQVSRCCSRWNEITRDDFLWRKLFQRDFKVAPDIGLKPGAESWYAEYRRLTENVPMILTDDLKDAHAHQVLHVSFSHNGKMFATCSKDGFVIIWNSSYPCTQKYSHDMKQFRWKYTQYSQFNQSDTLLLVSGVHFGSPQNTSGEIAVFSVTGDSHLRCRVINRPYDIFGTWFSDQHLISGELHWLAHLVSTSVLWLNKANQEVESEHVPVMNQLYKFYNKNASSIRGVLVANCAWMDNLLEGAAKIDESDDDTGVDSGLVAANRLSGNQMSGQNLSADLPAPASASDTSTDNPFGRTDEASPRSIQYSHDYRREYESVAPNESMDQDSEDSENDDNTGDANSSTSSSDNDDFNTSKYLIFSTGSKTYSPHQIGFKLIQNVSFPKRFDPVPSLRERIAARERNRRMQAIEPGVEAIEPTLDPDWMNYDSVASRFDKVDKLIDLHGHIIGMGLSPDHRYLYVNSRPWPKDYVITNALEPPPIAQEIDIHVIDLMTLKRVGNMLRAHKGYTPNTECFFLFLDVCDNYVASGAEDMHAYLWDRYYGVCLAKYQHGDVVNSVAFNSRDSQMLVTTSDDYTIKVWRSQQQVAELQATEIKRAVEFRRKN